MMDFLPIIIFWIITIAMSVQFTKIVTKSQPEKTPEIITADFDIDDLAKLEIDRIREELYNEIHQKVLTDIYSQKKQMESELKTLRNEIQREKMIKFWDCVQALSEAQHAERQAIDESIKKAQSEYIKRDFPMWLINLAKKFGCDNKNYAQIRNYFVFIQDCIFWAEANNNGSFAIRDIYNYVKNNKSVPQKWVSKQSVINISQALVSAGILCNKGSRYPNTLNPDWESMFKDNANLPRYDNFNQLAFYNFAISESMTNEQWFNLPEPVL